MLCHTSLFKSYLLISGYLFVFGEVRKGVKTQLSSPLPTTTLKITILLIQFLHVFFWQDEVKWMNWR